LADVGPAVADEFFGIAPTVTLGVTGCDDPDSCSGLQNINQTYADLRDTLNDSTILISDLNSGGRCMVIEGSGCQNLSQPTATDISIDIAGDGELQATPLPAALPLFVTGIAGLGLFGWRRKLKADGSLLGVA
jgi:hypothetical protein